MVNDLEDIGFCPPHPGEYLREDILPALNMTQLQLARHLGVTRQSLSGLINEKKSVSIDMAQKLGQAFENGTRFWLALQLQHDVWRAEKNRKDRISPLKWDETSAA